MYGKLSPQQIEQVLRSHVLGRIGCTDGDRIYVVPVNYVYQDNRLLCHSQAGMKIDMMRKHPQVCFEVDEMKSFTQWQSVIVQGHYEEVIGEKEKQDAAFNFITHLMLHKQTEAASSAANLPVNIHPRAGKARTIYYHIVIEEITGRFEDSESEGLRYNNPV
jgi:uncharacterized protein